MQKLLKDESTAARRRIPIICVDATDGVTPETGVTISAGDLKLSKNGAAEGNHAGTLTELAGGLYYYEATAGELDTLGFLTLRLSKSGVKVFYGLVQVVGHNIYEDPWNDACTELAAIPSTTSTRKTMLQYLFQFFRNRNKATNTTQTLYKEDGTTALGTATITETGTETDRGEFS